MDHVEATWLSKLLPQLISRHFEKRKRELVMWHAVPGELAKNKDLVAIFERHWNRHVSPGEAVYAHRGEGEQIIEQARKTGLVPTAKVHDREVFL